MAFTQQFTLQTGLGQRCICKAREKLERLLCSALDYLMFIKNTSLLQLLVLFTQLQINAPLSYEGRLLFSATHKEADWKTLMDLTEVMQISHDTAGI